MEPLRSSINQYDSVKTPAKIYANVQSVYKSETEPAIKAEKIKELILKNWILLRDCDACLIATGFNIMGQHFLDLVQKINVEEEADSKRITLYQTGNILKDLAFRINNMGNSLMILDGRHN